jgi:membrane peptidoglycan carboxypeptidase
VCGGGIGEHGRVNRIRSWSWKKRIGIGAASGFGLLVLLVLGGYLLTDLPPANASAVSEATVIRYADGGEIGRIGAQNRELVTLDKISDPAQKAVLAAEDRGFYTEPGISLKGIGRALFTNVKGGGGIQQGGSTITQQYAKNAYLTQNRTYTRKVKEVFIALKLSRNLPKDEILERYLNTIYFGRGASGIQVAAQTYFGTTAERLTVAQAAVLASTIRSPGAYDPTRHPERAQERFDYVLDGMVKKGWLTAAEREATTYPNVLKPGAGKQGNTNDRKGPKGYVLDMVEEELARKGIGEEQLAQGGYVVQTTLRRKAQEAAVRTIQEAVPVSSAQSAPQAALVSIKPDTGEVWAYYGGSAGNAGTDYANGETRQPGSSFKPYVLATALEAGTGLGTRYDGSAPQEICGQEIDNDEGDPPLGRIDLVKGLALSVNTVYFRLACDVGPKKVADLAKRAGIDPSRKLAESSGDTAAGIGLGIYPVSVFDQAKGYATFAAQGVHHEAHFVKTVKQGGDVVYKEQDEKQTAFSEDVAADATYAMQQVVEDGTGTRAQLAGNRPAAGKTGTTNENKDAWFCGFTPQLATAVWLGRPDRQPLKGVLGSTRGIYGGTIPAGIWKSYTDTALEGQEEEQFPKRANVGKSADVGNGSGGTSGGYTYEPRRSREPSAEPSSDSSPLPDQSPVPPPSQAPPSYAPPPSPQPEPSQPPPPPPSQEPPPSPAPS